MPTVYENRRENLRRLIEQWHGPGALGAKLGYSNASFLVQMCGPNPTREISERTARKVERTLDLPVGWAHGDKRTLRVAALVGFVLVLAACVWVVR